MRYLELLQKHPDLLGDKEALLRIITDRKMRVQWQNRRKIELRMNQQPLSFADLGIILEDPYFMVVRDLVEFPDGQMRGYCRVINQADLRGGRGVVVLPEYEGKIILLHQYRHPTRQWHYEVPRGYGEPNTPSIVNARKEIGEEIGGIITELFDLGEFYNNSGFEGSAVSLFFAKLSSIGSPNVNEGIESFVLLEIPEFEHWIADGKITDGFTIAAYLKAKLKNLV
jgi:ADP-ribose pyrophosphatase